VSQARRAAKLSAGLLLYRVREGATEVLLGHPGGPYWAHKDDGAWSMPKGEASSNEDLLEAARRETFEETGFSPAGPFVPLGSITQKSGKVVHAWAALHDGDVTTARSNIIQIEWPPRSGRRIDIPELDRAEYFSLADARIKVNPAQIAFLDRLEESALP
jgi:predicted NUDIX family NTP pyrophosphohydrolase